jgi:hypothetical protein
MTVVEQTGWFCPGYVPRPPWGIAPLGAGGWITGLDVHPDGTMFARPDTYGLYKFDRATETWTQKIHTGSLPPSEFLPYSIFGTYEVCIAPSNSSIVYIAWKDKILKSTNGGDTWVATALTGLSFDSNDDQRHYSPKMAVDPVNPDVVWFGENNNAVWYTHDGGATWTEQTDIAESIDAYGIVFDAASEVVDGRTSKIYIMSNGTGVYRSTNAGATFSLTEFSPITFVGITCSNNGTTSVDSTVLLVNGSRFLYRWVGGEWTEVELSHAGLWDVAVNPLNTDQVIVIQDAGRMSQSATNGATFIDQGDGNNTLFLNQIESSATIPWHELSNENSYMSHGGMRFDPLESHGPGTLFKGSGIGVFWTNMNTDDPLYKTVTWTSVSVGIEQLVMTDLVKLPGGGLLCVQLDRGSCYLTPELDTYPSYTAPSMTVGTVNGYSADVANDGKMWLLYDEGIYRTTTHASTAAMTRSNGAPFIGGYGQLAVNPGNSDNVVAQMSSRVPYYTTNNGASWTAATGAPASPFVPAFAKFHWLKASRATHGTFYLYAFTNGIYRSTNNGATWTQRYARTADGGPDTPLYDLFNNFFNVNTAVPDGADDFWIAGGHVGQFPDSLVPDGSISSLVRFTSGASVATRITNAAEPYRIAFGAPAPGKTYGTLFMVGWVDRGSGWEYGCWRCDDPDAGASLTWVDIDTWPDGAVDAVTALAGDPEVFGRVYVGFNGRGVVYRNTA